MKKKILAFVTFSLLIFSVLRANFVQAKVFSFGHFGEIRNFNLDDWPQRIEKMFEYWAKILGVNIEKIKNYWAEGKTIKEIMEAEKIKKEEVRKRLIELRLENLKTQLQKLVEKGIITQEQAERRLEFMKKQMEKIEEKKFTPKFHRFWLW